ncbi:TetR/AcrR family transcriptional regulator [Streptomyces tubbatahanensis]|uniref:TetR/AcrR family transcriptional regulator n=1 Tax=Streptomyces tubbatahanensis TaxID=2923272 RepID=A0ABY3XND3_9ACTN|nr:TetR/AcrR family transcriptional regulator [Streptomyces tubbatahanensis]UNS95926.1 TetR/AcrR family transcriptional regulator [Streptomyces tubbatahanensis]
MNESQARRRAPAMDPEQRRAMIVAAALPLVVEYGPLVTTAKIARAAGIGEGTLFRVFTDKEALLAACLEEALRPDDTLAHLEGISLDQPLPDRLTQAAEVMRGHMNRIGDVAGALASVGKAARPAAPETAGPEETRNRREAGLAAPRAALTSLFEPDRAVLRMAPERLADTFQLLLMSTGRPGAPQPLEDAELVDLFLHGALTAGPKRPEEGGDE